MKYASIDLETTGLDPKQCQILQVGMILDDTANPDIPLKNLPKLDLIIKYDHIVGEPYALNMNSNLLKTIAEGKDQRLIEPNQLFDKITEFLADNGYGPDKQGNYRITVAGKNVGSFDVQFLKSHQYNYLYEPNNLIINHKAIELGSLMFNPLADSHIPSLDECLKIAGIDKSVTHDAVDDAMDVVKCIRYVINKNSNNEI